MNGRQPAAEEWATGPFIGGANPSARAIGGIFSAIADTLSEAGMPLTDDQRAFLVGAFEAVSS